MADRFNQLPQFIRNLIPEPNYNDINLNELTVENAKLITNSIKTKTALELLNPLSVHEPDPLITFKPTILVFCQPSQELVIDRDKVYPYAPVAYASWLEAAGARCVPLPYNINEGSIQFFLERSHGLLIPGGGSNLYKNFDQKQGQGPVMIGFLKIWRFIQKLWAKGVYYPIWGTCLGLQIMLLALSGDVKILSRLNSRGHQVQIYSHYDNSWMLKKMPIKLRLKAQNCKLLNFQHTYGISVKKFLSEPKLGEKLKIVQISKDKDGKWFCSGMQGKNNPIFITQYHPEKQAYQWTRTGQIRHNRDSIELSQHLAMSFLSHCRRCKPPKEFGSLSEQIFHTIHNYKQIHTPEKMYKIYAIDFKYREYDKEIRKQIKSKRSISISSKGNLKF